MNKTYLNGLVVIFVAVLALATIGCGSSSGTTATETVVSSLNEIPDLSDMVTAGTANPSISSYAVTGTPPYLAGITETLADTFFWGGLVDIINTAGVATPDQIEPFWNGDTKCRVAQNIGYSMQNISQNGTSLCYMKNAPGTIGTAFVSGGSTINDDYTQLFVQGTDTHVVKVDATNQPGDQDDMNIFMTVYGSSTTEGANGYYTTLHFCNDADTAVNYEIVSVNNTDNTMAQTTYNQDAHGTYYATFAGYTVADVDGNIVFDPTKTQAVEYTWASLDETNMNKSYVSVLGTELQAKSWNYWGDGINKSYIIASIAGATTDILSFGSAGATNLWTYNEDSNTFTQGMEWQTTTYASDGTIAYYTTAHDFDLTTDSFFTGTLGIPETANDPLDGFDCTQTPDIEVSIDMSTPEMLVVVGECENNWSEMNFCDGAVVQSARDKVFTAQTTPH